MKSLRHIIIGLVGLSTLSATTSCTNFLEEEPRDEKVDDFFWTSKSDAEAAVNMLYYGGVPYLYGGRNTGWQPTRTMYNGLLSGLFVDKRKDGDFSANMEMLNVTFQTVNNDVTELYREPYVAIGRCNVIAERLPEMVKRGILSETDKNQLLAQVCFFRAWNYFFLVKEFGCKDGEPSDGGKGGVPLVLEYPESIDPTVVNTPRASMEEVYTQIEKDLNFALEGSNLPNTTFADNKCRVTKPAAQTLLANVYLQWAGYPLQNKAKYAEAAKMAEAVITGGAGHILEKNDDNGAAQQSAFNKIKTDKNSKEVIYAIEYNFDLNRGNPYINACLTGEALQWKDSQGEPVFKTVVLNNMYCADDRIVQSYGAGDVRGMEKNFFFTEYTSKEGQTYECPEYDNWFWFDEQSMIDSKTSSLNMPVYRLSEVYLIAAEALLKQNNPNPTKARGYLEEVRKRAFTVNGTTDASYSLPATITVGDVLTERLHELPLEMKVWDDIRRNRLYPQFQSDNSINWVDITTATTYNKRGGKSFKDNMHMLIWPIPQKAIERNPSLSQNPGY